MTETKRRARFLAGCSDPEGRARVERSWAIYDAQQKLADEPGRWAENALAFVMIVGFYGAGFMIYLILDALVRWGGMIR